MLSDVRVLAGPRRVARAGDVVAWFETGQDGGGEVLAEVLQTLEAAASGSVPGAELGARLAGVLNTADATSVPALAVAMPESGDLRVVVHGWATVVAGATSLPNGWADQVITSPGTIFLGRNTVAATPPDDGPPLDLEDGVVPGDGVSFVVAPPGSVSSAPVAATAGAGDGSVLRSPWAAPDGPGPAPGKATVAASRAGGPSGGAAPGETPPDGPGPSGEPGAPSPDPASQARPPLTTWPPPRRGSGARASGPSPGRSRLFPPPPADEPGGPADERPEVGLELSGAPPGRLVLDDGHSARLERTCVVGSAPHGSPAVQTGIATPLTVVGPGVAPLHAEIRVEHDRVAVRDLGGAATFVLPPGTKSWIPLAIGEITPLTPGTRVALGQRTISYERP